MRTPRAAEVPNPPVVFFSSPQAYGHLIVGFLNFTSSNAQHKLWSTQENAPSVILPLRALETLLARFFELINCLLQVTSKSLCSSLRFRFRSMPSRAGLQWTLFYVHPPRNQRAINQSRITQRARPKKVTLASQRKSPYALQRRTLEYSQPFEFILSSPIPLRTSSPCPLAARTRVRGRVRLTIVSCNETMSRNPREENVSECEDFC